MGTHALDYMDCDCSEFDIHIYKSQDGVRVGGLEFRGE